MTQGKTLRKKFKRQRERDLMVIHVNSAIREIYIYENFSQDWLLKKEFPVG
jgi:hypothetical protein